MEARGMCLWASAFKSVLQQNEQLYIKIIAHVKENQDEASEHLGT